MEHPLKTLGESEKDRNDQCGEYCFLHVRKPPFFHQ